MQRDDEPKSDAPSTAPTPLHPDEHLDGDGVPRRVLGQFHRSDLATTKAAVLIARDESVRGTKIALNASDALRTTFEFAIKELSDRLGKLNDTMEDDARAMVLFQAEIQNLESRTWRGRWRRFVAWLRSLGPERITEEQYAEKVEPTLGTHDAELPLPPVRILHLYMNTPVGHWTRDEHGKADFTPAWSGLHTLFETSHGAALDYVDRMSKQADRIIHDAVGKGVQVVIDDGAERVTV